MKDNRWGWLLFPAIALAIWLGWEILKIPFAVRAQPALAARLAPNSPEVLRRAAEAEFVAGRVQNAKFLAGESLKRAPFNVRALRTYGLSVAKEGETARADEILTLAGNWSLRDDPSHAWLIEQRLRQGNYRSAFAHADTLARRRPAEAKPIYNFFGAAAIADPRSLRPLAEVLRLNPLWRPAFIDYLVKRPDTDAVLLNLGVTLQAIGSSYSDTELEWVYQSWFSEGRLNAIKLLRERLNRPKTVQGLVNGEFSGDREGMILPFAWRLDPTPGATAEIIEDDLSPENEALWVEYDGYTKAIIAEQVVTLDPGMHGMTGLVRVENSPQRSRLKWSVRCIETGRIIGQAEVPPASPQGAEWKPFQMAFETPSTGCSMQMLRLESEPGDRRSTTVAWFDKLRIQSRSAPSSPAGR